MYENNKSAAQPIKDQISLELGVPLQYINSALVSAQNRQRFYAYNIPNIPQPKDRGILLKDILESGLPYQKKSHCLTASYNKAVIWNSIQRKQRSMIAEPVCCAQRGRYIKTGNRSVKCEGGTYQVLEPRTDGKSNCITTVQKDNMICEPIRLGHIGKSNGQANRIYSITGKSVCLQAQVGGGEAKTGLYAIPIEFENDIPTKAISCADGKTYIVYAVVNGQANIKNRLCPIKLPDGYYIIRKLTPIEAERLQTLPDNYTEGISNIIQCGDAFAVREESWKYNL